MGKTSTTLSTLGNCSDEYGNRYISLDDLYKALYQNPDLDLTKFLVRNPAEYNQAVQSLHAEFGLLKNYADLFADRDSFASVEEFDKQNQSNWFMPVEYQSFDIKNFCLNLCKDAVEKQRVIKEFELYELYDLLMLLRYLKYLVDTMREHDIVWGVGRGSSVASFVLYLIGVHRINSIKFNLDIKEFLK